MTSVREAFLEYSSQLLLNDFLPKIEIATRSLTDDDLWWRPNENSNSVGNLILHLAGNLRQWIVSGLGGEKDVRQRQEEFDQRDSIPRDQLILELRTAVRAAADAIDRVPEEELLRPRYIQGREVSALQAIYHAVEHFSMHTGQILYIVKLRTGRDLGFYRIVDGIPMASWRPQSEVPG